MVILNNMQYVVPIFIITAGVWIDRGWKGVLSFWLIVAGLLVVVEHVVLKVH